MQPMGHASTISEETAPRLGVQRLLLALVLLMFSAKAHADGSVEVTLNPRGQEVADELQINTDALTDELTTRINEAFDVLQIEDFLQAFANAAAFSNRGLGVDYASGSSTMELGVSGNVSVSLGDKGLGEVEADRPVAGLALNLTIMAG